MGLRDVIQGMKNGPRGRPQPSKSGGGRSRIMMAILAILAYKVFKGNADQDAPADSGNPNTDPPRRRWL